MQGTRGVGQVGRPLPVKVGDQGKSSGARPGRQGQPVELRQVHAQQGSRGIENAGGVQGADQRQVMPGSVGKPRHKPRGICRRGIRDGKDRARRAQGHHDVAQARTGTERGGRVVPGTRSQKAALRGASGRLQRAKDPGDGRNVPERRGQDVRRYRPSVVE